MSTTQITQAKKKKTYTTGKVLLIKLYCTLGQQSIGFIIINSVNLPPAKIADAVPVISVLNIRNRKHFPFEEKC